jgi:hypothetical protein
MSEQHDKSHGPGYETSDADVPVIVRYGFVMYVVIGLTFILMWALHFFFEKTPFKFDREATSMQLERNLPPTPRLQVNQSGDLKDFRAREEDRLHSYGWVNKQAGVVHVPIEKAIEAVASKGIPQPPPPKPEAKK